MPLSTGSIHCRSGNDRGPVTGVVDSSINFDHGHFDLVANVVLSVPAPGRPAVSVSSYIY
jgi:hypothetical protein